MLDMIVFWLTYGVVGVFLWFGWCIIGVKLLDMLISYWTSKDYKDFIWNKLPCWSDRKEVSSFIWFILSAVSVCSNLSLHLATSLYLIKRGEPVKVASLHNICMNIAEFVSTHLTTPIIAVLVLVVSSKLIKSGYSYFKQIKTKLDSIDNKD